MKTNLAIIIPKLAGGGAERVASNLSLYLPEEYERYIIVYDGENIDYPFKGKLIDIGIKSTANLFGKMINLIKRIYKIKRIKKKYNIQATISLMSGPNLVNIFTKNGDKVVISIRNYITKSANNFYGKLFKLLIKKFYNKADCIVVVSKALKKDLVANYGLDKEKIKVIYNPYDIEKIQNLAKEEIEEEYREIFNHPVIINMGRLNKQKGQWHLIRAFKKVKEAIPEIKLVILGVGKLEDYLKRLISELGLENDVYLLGFQKNPFKFISKSSIFVFPSLYEGFPNALAEAMACEIPVISSDCKSGPRELLAPYTDIEIETKIIEYAEYGVLIPVCNDNYYKKEKPLTEEEKKIVEVILGLFGSKEMVKKYRHKAYERINHFNSKEIILEYENILEEKC